MLLVLYDNLKKYQPKRKGGKKEMAEKRKKTKKKSYKKKQSLDSPGLWEDEFMGYKKKTKKRR